MRQLMVFNSPEERRDFARLLVWIHNRAEALRAKKNAESVSVSEAATLPAENTESGKNPTGESSLALLTGIVKGEE